MLGLMTRAASAALESAFALVRLPILAAQTLEDAGYVLRQARPLVDRLTAEAETGLIEQVRRVLTRLDEGIGELGRGSDHIEGAAGHIEHAAGDIKRAADNIERIGTSFDEKIAPVVEAALEMTTFVKAQLPLVERLTTTIEEVDVESAAQTVERLVRLVDATLQQLELLPGAKMVRRRREKQLARSADVDRLMVPGDAADRQAPPAPSP
jgi:ABC-type transporter Mla subunit MlaD